MSTELERRSLPVEQAELRYVNQSGTRYIEGYAVKYNNLSQNLGGFRETIAPGAFKESLTKLEVRAFLDHKDYLARQKNGTLVIEDRPDGLYFRAQVPNTTTGNDVIELMQRGDLAGCSFGFANAKDSWSRRNNENVREIRTASLFDVSVVYNPAYPVTEHSLALRSLEEWKKEDALEDAKLAEIQERYNNLRISLL